MIDKVSSSSKGIFKEAPKNRISRDELLDKHREERKDIERGLSKPKDYADYKKSLDNSEIITKAQSKELAKHDVASALFKTNTAVNTLIKGTSYKSHSAKTSFGRGFARNTGIQRRKIL